MPSSSESTVSLKSPCAVLRGVGVATAEKLKRMQLETVEDLLFHLPSQYRDSTRITEMCALQHGGWAVVEGLVCRAHVVFGKRRSLQCQISDGTGTVTMVLFHFGKAQQQVLQKAGLRLRCVGEVSRGLKGWQMVHPSYQLMPEDETLPLADRLTPVYPATAGLSQHLLCRCIGQALGVLSQSCGVTDWLPIAWLKAHDLPSLQEALEAVHAPQPDADVDALLAVETAAQQRLIIEELATHQLALMRVRVQMKPYRVALGKRSQSYIPTFLKQLPYALTDAQHRVVHEIAGDLQRDCPMMRLLQGDVGSGKTVVAALAILQVVERRGKAAIMAPTELLAEQHWQCFAGWFEPLGLKVRYLTGQMQTTSRQRCIDQLACGNYDVVVGTHALFQADVVLSQLALTIIDEQHRFGVKQRLALWQKGLIAHHCPHQLLMSATPIPRTLALLAYAELDFSVIDAMPAGRLPVHTTAMPIARRDDLLTRLVRHCAIQQCYWVCTLIDPSDTLACQAAEASFAWLKQHIPEVPMALVHGRMKADEKQAIMQQFKANRVKLLVATTVIEVGVDVPNATLMIIENAERLGLSQLHQLRGRVGRGASQSHCVLLYQQPLSQMAEARLGMMRDTQDGFLLAEKDLAMRGPGDVMGTRQAGLCQFRMSQVKRDAQRIDQARDLAHTILRDAPDHVEPLLNRWLDRTADFVVA